MNYVENLKLAQWRTLFKLFKYSRMQSFNIFGARGDLLFEFASLSRVWKLENYLTRPGPHVSSPFLFDRPGLLPGLARHPYFWWLCSPRGERSVPVATGRHRPHGLPPPPYHCSGRHRGSRRPVHFSPPTVRSCSSLLCSTLATASPPSTIIDEPPQAI
jgi:hypothetical protein